MKTNKNNLALSFIVVLTCICFQLCFLENQASAMSIMSLNPTDNSTGVAVDSNLVITFSQNWEEGGPGDVGAIVIHNNDGSTFESYSFPAYPANITGEGTTTLTINPTSNLSGSSSYYVTIDNDIIKSQGGNDYYHGLGMTGWDFTTAAAPPPCYNPPSCIGPCFGTDDIDHLSPPDNAHFMQSYEGLAIVFGSNVTLGTGNLYIREYVGDATVSTIDVTSGAITGWGTNTLTIDIPDNILANNTHYYVNFDIEGWSLPANKDNWDFWTKATPNTFSGSGL